MGRWPGHREGSVKGSKGLVAGCWARGGGGGGTRSGKGSRQRPATAKKGGLSLYHIVR